MDLGHPVQLLVNRQHLNQASESQQHRSVNLQVALALVNLLLLARDHRPLGSKPLRQGNRRHLGSPRNSADQVQALDSRLQVLANPLYQRLRSASQAIPHQLSVSP